MIVARFEPERRVILVDVCISGPADTRDLSFILDTGSPVTIVNTEVIDLLGYSARMATERSRLIGAVGAQEGYQIAVDRLETMGFVIESCRVRCHDFEEEAGAVDGLIGMDLLEGRILTIDGIAGIVSIEGGQG